MTVANSEAWGQYTEAAAAVGRAGSHVSEALRYRRDVALHRAQHEDLAALFAEFPDVKFNRLAIEQSIFDFGRPTALASLRRQALVASGRLLPRERGLFHAALVAAIGNGKEAQEAAVVARDAVMAARKMT